MSSLSGYVPSLSGLSSGLGSGVENFPLSNIDFAEKLNGSKFRLYCCDIIGPMNHLLFFVTRTFINIQLSLCYLSYVATYLVQRMTNVLISIGLLNLQIIML